MIKNSKFEIKDSNNGAVGLLATMLILFSSLALITSFTYMIYVSKEGARIATDSTKSFYVGESGIEDILLRLKNGMPLPYANPYTLTVGNGTTTVTIGSNNNGVETITSDGNQNQKFRKTSINYVTDPNQASFYYGAQVGDGGMRMGNGSSVTGNVFSNGSIVPRQSGNNASISGTAKVASASNSIDSISVGGSAYASWLKNCSISGTGYYTASGGISNCSAVGGFQELSLEIATSSLPISQSSIDKWESDAAAGGIINGSYSVSSKTTVSFGPKEISGNLSLSNNATLNMTGTLWVAGTITLSNGAIIKLDSSAYGDQSGVIVANGNIRVQQNTGAYGTGESGSYIMLLTTSSSSTESNPAIDVNNNSASTIFYAQNGMVYLHNGVFVKSVTAGYALDLDNNTNVTYETGLVDTDFKSGPSGGWSVNSWQETQ